MLQAWDNDGSILDHIPIGAVALHHKVDGEIKLAAAMGHVLAVHGVYDLGVVGDDGHVVAPTHKFTIFACLARDVRLEDFHHVFLGIRGLRRGRAVAVRGNV